MWKEVTIADFPKVCKAIEEINSWEIHDLYLTIDTDSCNKVNTVEIHDNTEELYYEGFRFEKVMDMLELALKEDTNDGNAYLDCVCPGRYIADYKGSSAYDDECAYLDSTSEIWKSIDRYMESNGIENFKFDDDLRRESDLLEDSIKKFFEHIKAKAERVV